MPNEASDGRRILSVSELAEALQGLLQDALPSLWVQGEVSNFRNPTGHWYFTLKDDRAQVRCAMFKSANFYVRPQPKDGEQVLIRGALSYYAARGDLQIVAEHLEPAGAGALLRAFEELKKKLAAEGLFDAKTKRPIPPAPRAIGLVTSRKGAAIEDVLTTLRRRYPLGVVYVHPVPVQGPGAAWPIAEALRQLPLRAPVDVILLVRGGGSIEDLWCFNDERIARAIRACPVPVVTGIGHEIDFTIADFAADLRAPTPTAAAELATPDLAAWCARAAERASAMAGRFEALLRRRHETLERTRSRLLWLHPGRRLQQQVQRLDEARERLQRVYRSASAQRAQRLLHLDQRLAAASPLQRITRLRGSAVAAREMLRAHLHRRLARATALLDRQQALLQSFNPRAVLTRGYAIARTAEGRILRDAAQVAPGDRLAITLASGEVDSEVREVRPARPDDAA